MLIQPYGNKKWFVGNEQNIIMNNINNNNNNNNMNHDDQQLPPFTNNHYINNNTNKNEALRFDNNDPHKHEQTKSQQLDQFKK